MITEEQEQYNHRKQQESIVLADDTSNEDFPPDRTASPQVRPGRGLTSDELATLDVLHPVEELVRLKYEGLSLPATTDKPRLVTRGPHPTTTTPPTPLKNHFTKIDTLSFTAKEPYWILQELIELACPGAIFIKLKTGKNGYHSGFSVQKNKMELAQLFYGSKSNERQNEKPQLQIGGNGKTEHFNWLIFYHYAQFMEKPTITRCDVCNDCFDGSQTIEVITQAHLDGMFKTLKSNKNPRITPYGQIQPDGSNPGRTVYIGSLSSSKSVRFYEKGFEMFKNILNSEESKDELAKKIIEGCISEGSPVEVEGYNDNKPIDLAKWLRSEVQFRNSNCEIPIDILVNHDEYFAGAYPYLKEVLGMAEGKVNPRFKTVDEVQLQVRIQNMKAIAGSLIDDLLVLGWNEIEIVEALKGGKGASQKLIRSGAYRDC